MCYNAFPRVNPTAGKNVKRIESARNPLIKTAFRLQRSQFKDSDGFLVEGEKLIREALRSGAALKCLFITEGYESAWNDNGDRNGNRNRNRNRNGNGLEEYVAVLPEKVMKKLSQLENPPSAIGLFSPPPPFDLNQALENSRTVVVLDRVQDPGNLGTIIRSCEGLGAECLILLKGSCSPLNPKVIRAAAGSSFRVPIVPNLDGPEALSQLRRHGFRCIATAGDGKDLRNSTFPERCAFFLGTEGTGLSNFLRDECDERIAIPMVGVTESFNVSIATAICLYERLRRKPAMMTTTVAAPMTVQSTAQVTT